MGIPGDLRECGVDEFDPAVEIGDDDGHRALLDGLGEHTDKRFGLPARGDVFQAALMVENLPRFVSNGPAGQSGPNNGSVESA
jgi:hypothetical protein